MTRVTQLSCNNHLFVLPHMRLTGLVVTVPRCGACHVGTSGTTVRRQAACLDSLSNTILPRVENSSQSEHTAAHLALASSHRSHCPLRSHSITHRRRSNRIRLHLRPSASPVVWAGSVPTDFLALLLATDQPIFHSLVINNAHLPSVPPRRVPLRRRTGSRRLACGAVDPFSRRLLLPDGRVSKAK